MGDDIIERLKEMTEEELRDFQVPWPSSQVELTEMVQALLHREHDYGTSAYAASIAATATFFYMSKKLGLTGFQASCADLDILRRTREMDSFIILDLSKLLYPQFIGEFKDWYALVQDNKEWVVSRAKKLLETRKACPRVRTFWQFLASLDDAPGSENDV